MKVTNAQVLRELMNHSKSGVLMEAFIIEGLRAYSEHVLKSDMPDSAMVSANAWKACAQEVIEKLDKVYGTVIEGEKV